MGNLHSGHIHLVSQAKSNVMWWYAVFLLILPNLGLTKILAVTHAPLKPIANNCKQPTCDLLFAPSAQEMYPMAKANIPS
jgi:pantothenate synthetase